MRAKEKTVGLPIVDLGESKAFIIPVLLEKKADNFSHMVGLVDLN